MKSSLHSLIIFSPLFCSYQFRRFGSIQFLCSEAHILAGWRLETRLFTSDYSSVSFYKPSARTPRKTQPLFFKKACLLIRCLAMDVLFLRALVRVGMCSPRRCLAMGIHVTTCYEFLLSKCSKKM
jgi:hypothetical protein